MHTPAGGRLAGMLREEDVTAAASAVALHRWRQNFYLSVSILKSSQSCGKVFVSFFMIRLCLHPDTCDALMAPCPLLQLHKLQVRCL